MKDWLTTIFLCYIMALWQYISRPVLSACKLKSVLFGGGLAWILGVMVPWTATGSDLKKHQLACLVPVPSPTWRDTPIHSTTPIALCRLQSVPFLFQMYMVTHHARTEYEIWHLLQAVSNNSNYSVWLTAEISLMPTRSQYDTLALCSQPNLPALTSDL